MQTLALGSTGVEVSALCLGAMYFGTRNDLATSYQMLDEYVGAGGTFIDTANIYAHWVDGFAGGESETLLGGWLRERKNRADVFIASKVGFNYDRVPQSLNAALIEVECNKSLQRLGVETLDLYYAHVDDRATPLEETLEAFNRLVQAGKVRFVGASNYRAWRLEEARWLNEFNGWADFCCIQQRYTYLHPRPLADFAAQVAVNEDLLDYCRNSELRLLAYSSLLGGAYTRADRPLPDQYASADNEARLRMLRQVADETGATPNQIVLAWLLQSEPAVIPVMAASTHEQMQENLDALNVQLSADQLLRLNTAAA